MNSSSTCMYSVCMICNILYLITAELTIYCTCTVSTKLILESIGVIATLIFLHYLLSRGIETVCFNWSELHNILP